MKMQLKVVLYFLAGFLMAGCVSTKPPSLLAPLGEEKEGGNSLRMLATAVNAPEDIRRTYCAEEAVPRLFAWAKTHRQGVDYFAFGDQVKECAHDPGAYSAWLDGLVQD
jgi:hypothetical protein